MPLIFFPHPSVSIPDSLAPGMFLRIHCEQGYNAQFSKKYTLFYFFKCFIYLFLERGKRKEKEMQRSVNAQQIHRSVASFIPPAGDPAHNTGMFHDWESSQQPFGLQARTQSMSHTSPGNTSYFSLCLNIHECNITMELVLKYHRIVMTVSIYHSALEINIHKCLKNEMNSLLVVYFYCILFIII